MREWHVPKILLENNVSHRFMSRSAWSDLSAPRNPAASMAELEINANISAEPNLSPSCGNHLSPRRPMQSSTQSKEILEQQVSRGAGPLRIVASLTDSYKVNAC